MILIIIINILNNMTECEICYLQYNDSMECKFICNHSVCFKCFMKLSDNELKCPFCSIKM